MNLDQARLDAFTAVLPAISAFKRAFGRDLSADFVAELYVARELGLQLPDRCNEPGCDAFDQSGKRYQIKHRNVATLNIDANNFDFDFIVLVNMDDIYQLVGMWQLSVDQARKLFVHREKYRKWQVTQDRFKREAVRVR
jgi:hypothetical protein